jgi:ribosome-binding protein aMBF1 (putative translation factor)
MLRFHGYSVRPRGRQRGQGHHQPGTAACRLRRGDPSFGRALRQLRQQRHLSQERLSLRSQLHRNYISGIERGEISPTLRAVKHLAHGLGIRPSQLLAAAELLDAA